MAPESPTPIRFVAAYRYGSVLFDGSWVLRVWGRDTTISRYLTGLRHHPRRRVIGKRRHCAGQTMRQGDPSSNHPCSVC